LKPSELSVAILYMRKFDYDVPVIVFTPRTRIKTLRGVAKARNYALMKHTLMKYGIIARWHEVFHKPYSGEPMFFWTLGRFQRFVENWITENIKTKRAREGAEARLRRVVEKALVEAENFVEPERGGKSEFLDIIVERHQYYSWKKARAIFERGALFYDIVVAVPYTVYEGRSFKDYICLLIDEENQRRYIWIRKDLDPFAAVDNLARSGLLDFLDDISKRLPEVNFHETPETKDAIDYFKKIIAAYQFLYL